LPLHAATAAAPAGTFTKSFGSAGGYIAGSKQLIAYMKRHCPAHLYATSMAPGVMQQIISAIKLLQVCRL
jgi:serine palmitoyltransferase